ncbi:MAG: hypothetical protein CK426_06835 [Legionella sp.]|nr:MAG: hypothetical protein CK423_02695 [Legionella sp.]PJD98057.1 MAG: hypothetical protein CK426_06835 [Legionella sp.]
MRYITSCLLIALLSFGLVINEAAAKRFGGGRSFGMQRSHSSLFSNNKAQSNHAYTQKQQSKSRWGGVLGGLLVGGLLGSLFMGHGFASGIMSWLMLGLAAFFIMNWLQRRRQPMAQTAASATNSFKANAFNPFQSFQGSTHASASQPVDFVSDSFVRQAKVCFIRLQAAYDQKNLADLQAFTLPEVYAEIQMQLEERGHEFNKTEVIELHAELLDVSKQAHSTVASVRFTGKLKENDAPQDLNEIWHFRQINNSKEWLVGGIQHEVYQP